MQQTAASPSEFSRFAESVLQDVCRVEDELGAGALFVILRRPRFGLGGGVVLHPRTRQKFAADKAPVAFAKGVRMLPDARIDRTFSLFGEEQAVEHGRTRNGAAHASEPTHARTEAYGNAREKVFVRPRQICKRADDRLCAVRALQKQLPCPFRSRHGVLPGGTPPFLHAHRTAIDKRGGLWYDRDMKIYYTRAPVESGAFLENVLAREYGGPAKLVRTADGKPYLDAPGAPKFSLTHTEGLTAVAIGPCEVGLDAEKKRPRNIRAVLARCTLAEQREDFLTLWTAKESYVKFRGATLASLYRHLVYADGVLYEDGSPLPLSLCHFGLAGCILCLCTAEPVEVTPIEL